MPLDSTQTYVALARFVRKDNERERGEDLKGDIFQQRAYLVSDLHSASVSRRRGARNKCKTWSVLKTGVLSFLSPRARHRAQVIRKLSLPYISLLDASEYKSREFFKAAVQAHECGGLMGNTE